MQYLLLSSNKQWLRERVSVLRYTYIACLVKYTLKFALQIRIIAVLQSRQPISFSHWVLCWVGYFFTLDCSAIYSVAFGLIRPRVTFLVSVIAFQTAVLRSYSHQQFLYQISQFNLWSRGLKCDLHPAGSFPLTTSHGASAQYATVDGWSDHKAAAISDGQTASGRMIWS
jgi:hypothetical protein